MKKLSTAIIAIGLVITSCSKEDENTGKVTVNIKQTTNVVRFAEDFTDDGVENFVERMQSDYPYVCVFYYRQAEKKVILNSFDDHGNEIFLDSFIVDSEKNGDIICHNQNLNCTFRFLDGEVDQIYKYSIGYRKARYIKK